MATVIETKCKITIKKGVASLEIDIPSAPDGREMALINGSPRTRIIHRDNVMAILFELKEGCWTADDQANSISISI